jgi:hypothetical protein
MAVGGVGSRRLAWRLGRVWVGVRATDGTLGRRGVRAADGTLGAAWLGVQAADGTLGAA